MIVVNGFVKTWIGIFILFMVVGGRLSSTIPCPVWEEAVYANGKCFKLFQVLTHWDMAQNSCKSQREGSRLAEPRTVEEIEALISFNSVGWIGANNLMFLDRTYHFDSDRAKMDFFHFMDPTDFTCLGLCCVRMREGLFRTTFCIKKHGYFCEIALSTGVAQHYIVPLHGLKTENPSNVSGFSLEIAMVTWNVVVDINVTILSDGGTGKSTMLYVYDSSPVERYTIADFSSDSFKPTQINCIQVLTSHPVTLTLMYKKDSLILRTLTYPMTHDITGSGEDTTHRFHLVSPNGIHYIKMSIVSMHQGVTDVNIDFSADYTNNNYIVLDSLIFGKPSEIKFSLSKFQSLQLTGKLNVEGIKIMTSMEAAVYVIVYETQNDMDTNTACDFYQVLPGHITSFDYVTLPFDLIGENPSYAFVTSFNQTTIEIDDRYYYFQTDDSFDVVTFSSNRSTHVTGYRPFQMFKVYDSISVDTNGIQDKCMVPLLPPNLWPRDHLIVSTDWMSSIEGGTLLLVLDRAVIYNFTLNGERQDLNCTDVKGSTNLTTCVFDLKNFLDQQPLPPLALHLRIPGKFGVYLFWTIEGKLRCQVMSSGMLLGGNELGSGTIVTPKSVVETSETSSHIPTTQSTITSGEVLGLSTISSSEKLTSFTTTSAYTFTGPGSTPTGGLGNITQQELQERLIETQKLLYINHRETSKFIRKKTSAVDSRPSSTAIGYVGVVFIFITFSAFVISDAINILFKPSLIRTRLIHKNYRQHLHW